MTPRSTRRIGLLCTSLFITASMLACSGGSSSRPSNAPPTAVVTTPTGVVSGTVSIPFDLLDNESDPVDIVAEFSTDSGTTFAPANVGTFPTTGLASSPGGTGHVLPWQSHLDGVGLTAPVTTVRIRITPSDPRPGTRGETMDFTVDNTTANLPPTAILTTPPGVTSGTVSIPFDLLDNESDPVDIVAEFSTDSGTTFAPANVGTFPTTGLASSPGGTGHVLPWESALDGVGLTAPVTTVRIRITPSDAVVGTAGETMDFTVDNAGPNTPPTAILTTPAGVTSGTVSIPFDLLDNESDLVDIVPEFSTDSGATFFPANVGTFPTTGLASSPGGVGHVLPWESVLDGVALTAPINTVRIRITPSDAAIGTAGETADFIVDNATPNGPPTAVMTTPTCVLSGTAAPIPVLLSDPDSDPVSIDVEFSTDGGVTFAMADVGGFPLTTIPTTPAGLGYVLPWNTVADGVGIGGPISTVRIRVTPYDFPPIVGTPGETGDFTVDNTVVPNYLFVHHNDMSDRDVSVFQVDICSGAIAETPNSPFPLDATGSLFGTWDLLFEGGRLFTPYWRTSGWVGAYDFDAALGDLTIVPTSPVQSGGEYCRTIARGGSWLFAVHMQTLNITVFDYDAATGALTATAGSPFATDGRQPIRIDYGGGRVFCTNTLFDSGTGNPPGIAVMDVDPVTGDLAHVAGSPFAFSDPDFILYEGGRLIGTRNSPSTQISVMDVDPTTGALADVAGSPFAATGLSATEVVFAADRIFVTHTDSNGVGVFDLDPATGALTEVTGSPFATGAGPWGIAVMQGLLFVANRWDDTISVYQIDPTSGALTEVPYSPFPSGGLDTSVLEVSG